MHLQRTFARTVGISRAKTNTYKEFGKWITEVFNVDPTSQELEDISHDNQFDYTVVTAAPILISTEEEQHTAETDETGVIAAC